MNILSLHFGHDGAVAVVVDGKPKVVLLTERISRIKHALSLDGQMIEMALAESGLTLGDIDYCSVTTTQTFPIVISRRDRFMVHLRRDPRDKVPSGAEDATGGGRDLDRLLNKTKVYFDRWPTNPLLMGQFHRQMAGAREAAEDSKIPRNALQLYRDSPSDMNFINCPEDLPRPQNWGLHDIRTDLRFAFHYPITFEMDGVSIPGAFVDHHCAHAAGSYFQSGLKSSAVLTYDGAPNAKASSLLYVGRGNALYPVGEPGLWLGCYYNLVADYLGLRYDAGKLMGLAPYGKPIFFEKSFVGGLAELGFSEATNVVASWLSICAASEQARSGTSPEPAKILTPYNVNVAASAHLTFEENVVRTVTGFSEALKKHGIAVEGLCLSGGCALSCPTNTRLALESDFGRVFVDPGCDDSGLALGAALWAYHNLFDKPLNPRDPDFSTSPYLGAAIPEGAARRALSAGGKDFEIAELNGAAAAAAASDLAADKVIGWYEGRSEIGPRALGHRSLLADPRKKENWPRVNKIKGREGWRPFAPAVLRNEADKWFHAMPLPSPYMLFTGLVRDPGALPAITHVDGTARVQTVDKHCGQFFELVSEFNHRTGCPVVLNTSLNGPGEPIVETPEHALAFLSRSDIDAIYIDGFRVAKKA